MYFFHLRMLAVPVARYRCRYRSALFGRNQFRFGIFWRNGVLLVAALVFGIPGKGYLFAVFAPAYVSWRCADPFLIAHNFFNRELIQLLGEAA